MKLIVLGILMGYFLLMSILDFILYTVDKVRAMEGKWRIQEKVLLGIGILGGAFGGLLGMEICRHKTKHWYFWAINLAALLVQLLITAAVGVLIP